MLRPICSSPSSWSLSRAATQRVKATPPPGTMPSSTAARVACMASFDARLLLFHFGLGRGSNFDHSHSTDQLRQPFLQLLAVVVAGRLLDLAANFFYTAFDLAVLALVRSLWCCPCPR